MNKYACFYNGKSVELKADTLYAAKQKAVDHFRAGKRHHMVSVVLIEKNGEVVKVDPASL